MQECLFINIQLLFVLLQTFFMKDELQLFNYFVSTFNNITCVLNIFCLIITRSVLLGNLCRKYVF